MEQSRPWEANIAYLVKFSAFMEPEVSLPCLLQSAIVPYPEPVESCQHPNYLSKVNFNATLPSTPNWLNHYIIRLSSSYKTNSGTII
jgi:hypothetical protein